MAQAFMETPQVSTNAKLRVATNDLSASPANAAVGKVVPMRRRSDTYGAGRSDGLQTLLMGALDEIDYGMILIDAHGRVCHSNHMARAEIGRNEHLRIEDDRLIACAFEHREALATAVVRASRGARSLVDLTVTTSHLAPLTVAVVPVGLTQGVGTQQPSAVLVITGKQQMCEQISLQFFARRYALSRSEQIVLLALAQGASVQEVATERGLALSTVRSQVKDIRVKTRCKSMRELLGKVSALPPLVSSIKGSP